MKKIILLLFLSPYLLAIQCPDQECQLIENWEQESYVPLITISPLQPSYTVGDRITLSVTVPASNDYFGESIDLIDETGDEMGLLQLISVEGKGDLFQGNQVTVKKGGQGRFPVWFEMAFKAETGNYELEAEITLNRTGSYTQLAEGYVDFGPSDCPDFKLNLLYAGVDEQFLEFSVSE